MKRIITMLTAAAIIFCFAVSAYAIKIDGVAHNSEWSQAEIFDLSKQKKFGNSVKNGIIKAQNSTENGCVYFLIMTEFEKNGDINNGKIVLSVNGDDDAEINILDGLVYDGGYNIEAEAFYDENSGTSIIETAVYFKDDITPSDVFLFNIVDFQGEESNTFSFSFTEEEANPSDGGDEEVSESKTSKTAKSKSSSKKTSSEKSKTTDSFNFKKVEKTDAQHTESSESDVSLNASENMNEAQPNGINKKYIYTAVGSVCALGVAVAAVVSAMKSTETKNKKDD